MQSALADPGQRPVPRRLPDFQRVLDAQRALFVQQDSYLLSRSSAVSNLIALYKALGGGWYSPQPLLDEATLANRCKPAPTGATCLTNLPDPGHPRPGNPR